MADSSLPPLSPLGGTPPPLPPVENDELLLPEEEDRSASLSPFKMLKKTGAEPVAPLVPPAPGMSPPPPLPSAVPVPPPVVPLPQGAPAPVPVNPQAPVVPISSGSPMSENLDESELVSRAAQAPTQPLILPNRRAVTNDGLPPMPTGLTRAEFKAPTPVNPEELRTIKVDKRSEGEMLPEESLDENANGPIAINVAKPKEPIRTGEPAKPLSIQRNGAAIPPPPPLPSAGVRPPIAPKATLQTQPLRTSSGANMLPPSKLPPLPLTSAPRKGGRLFAIIGSIVALVLLIGGGFVLALTGARLPVLGSAISGLPGNVTQASDKAFAFVDAKAPYEYVGATEINVTDEKSKTLDDGTPAIYKIHTETSDGIVTDKGTRSLSSSNVTVNDTTAVPVLMRDTGTEYIVSFPANTNTNPATLASTNLDDTLLGPALHFVPLETLLKAVVSEKSYQKVTIDGKPAAAYTVSLDTEKMKEFFPTDATLSSANATLSYAWKGAGVVVGQPLDVVMSIAFGYKDRTYSFSSHWQYSNWGESAVPTDLDSLASTDPGNINISLTSESFVSRLGIAFKALPHGAIATSGSDVDETAVFTPIIPDGDVITVVQAARALNPTIPVQPASTEAKQRDAQRKQDLQNIQKAIEQYKVVNGSYPSVAEEMQLASNASLFAQLVPKYLTKMPIDPLNSTYYYVYNVTSTGYYLRAILEDASDTSSVAGSVYHYYELKN